MDKKDFLELEKKIEHNEKIIEKNEKIINKNAEIIEKIINKIKGYSIVKMAQLLNVSEGTVSVMVSKLKKKIRKIL